MSRRLLFGGVLAVLCLVALVFGGALLSATLAPETADEILTEEHGFDESELDRVGSAQNPVGYGGTPGPIADPTDRYGPVAEPYWRTATYDRYTRKTWEMTDAVDGLDTIDAIQSDGDTQQYAIDTWGLSDAVPVPSGTTAVDETTAQRAQLLPDGSLYASEPFSPGTTLTVERADQTWEYDDFDVVSSGYPEELSPYTTLPDELPSRVTEKASAITDGVESPYVSAILLEQWLLSQNEYAVDAEAEDDWLVDEFLFEREDGTSEFFATAFATMARSQDIPARYVTGFAPGETTDEGQEAVRGTNAHAWVELYFEDIGWVPFDPTPADHIEKREAAVEDGVETTVESFGGVGEKPQFLRSDSDWKIVDDDELSVEFIEQPTPGTSATVEVTADGTPLVEHRISVDGEVAGLTDEDGQRTVDIPYTNEITVTVERYTGEGSPQVDTGDEDEQGEDQQDDDGQEDGGDRDGDEDSGEITGGEGTTDGGLGALTPGEETGVGGDVGFEPETYGNSDTSVHFTVESKEPAYWRTDAYDKYTGAGWQQTGEQSPYDEPLERTGEQSDTVEYEVTLEREATALPTVWRPEALSGVDELSVTEQSGIHADTTLPEGTTYSGVSSQPPDDVDTLRSADGAYPDDILDRYTQRPEDEPERIDELTADIVGGEPTAYDKTMAVQEWLRDEKEYSLDVGTTSDQIADTFIFEMDAGYCEYFATAMVSMLRSQDIPTRYVVGYATGEEVAEDTYEVRGMNAHAWVEVYFPDVGWVTFDPTPGDDRLSNEEDLLERDDPDNEPSLESIGSPGESVTAEAIERETDAIIDETDFETGGYADHLSVSTEITVGDGASSQSDQLRFVAEETEAVDLVPLADLQPVTVETGTLQSFSGGSGLTDATVLTAPVRTGTVSEMDRTSQTTLSDGGEVNFSLDADLSVSLGEETTPGASLSIEATIDDVPVPDASVEMYQTGSQEELLRTARTDSEGQATVDLPGTASVVIAVTRGQFSETETHAIDDSLDISFKDDPIPGKDVSLAVTSDDEPVSGFPVTLRATEAEGEASDDSLSSEGRTADDGTVTLSAPYAEEFTATVTADELEATDTVTIEPQLSVSDGNTPGENVTLTVSAGDEPVSGLAVSPGETETDDDGTATVSLPFANETTVTASRGAIELSEERSLSGEFQLRTTGPPVPGTSVTATVTMDGEPVEGADIQRDGETVETTDEEGEATVSLPANPTANGEIAAIHGELRSKTTVPVQYSWLVVGGLVTGIFGVVLWRTDTDSLRTQLLLAPDSLLSLLIGLINRMRGTMLRLRKGVDDSSLLGNGTASDTQRNATDDDSPATRYWRRFVAIVGAEPTDTPAEIATRAVNAGLPVNPVRRIVSSYRSYRYGESSSTESDELEEAVKTVEREAHE